MKKGFILPLLIMILILVIVGVPTWYALFIAPISIIYWCIDVVIVILLMVVLTQVSI